MLLRRLAGRALRQPLAPFGQPPSWLFSRQLPMAERSSPSFALTRHLPISYPDSLCRNYSSRKSKKKKQKQQQKDKLSPYQRRKLKERKYIEHLLSSTSSKPGDSAPGAGLSAFFNDTMYSMGHSEDVENNLPSSKDIESVEFDWEGIEQSDVEDEEFGGLKFTKRQQPISKDKGSANFNLVEDQKPSLEDTKPIELDSKVAEKEDETCVFPSQQKTRKKVKLTDTLIEPELDPDSPVDPEKFTTPLDIDLSPDPRPRKGQQPLDPEEEKRRLLEYLEKPWEPWRPPEKQENRLNHHERRRIKRRLEMAARKKLQLQKKYGIEPGSTERDERVDLELAMWLVMEDQKDTERRMKKWERTAKKREKLKKKGMFKKARYAPSLLS